MQQYLEGNGILPGAMLQSVRWRHEWMTSSSLVLTVSPRRRRKLPGLGGKSSAAWTGFHRVSSSLARVWRCSTSQFRSEMIGSRRSTTSGRDWTDSTTLSDSTSRCRRPALSQGTIKHELGGCRNGWPWLNEGRKFSKSSTSPLWMDTDSRVMYRSCPVWLPTSHTDTQTHKLCDKPNHYHRQLTQVMTRNRKHGRVTAKPAG